MTQIMQNLLSVISRGRVVNVMTIWIAQTVMGLKIL